MTLEPTAADRTFDEALALQQAKDPNNHLIDITEQLDTARCNRLLSLMLRRWPDFKDLQEWNENLSSYTATDNYIMLSMIASIVVTRVRSRYGVTWPEIESTFKAGRGPKHVVLAFEKVARAARLLDHLLMVGCIKRGEVSDANH